MTEEQLDQRTRLTARTFATRLAEVKNTLAGRDEAVDLVALALLCREHVLLVGPPGTAKTLLLDRVSALLRARYFSYLLTRFTEPAELFGPVDPRTFQQEGVFRLNTADMLPEAHLAFLDEIFQGSSAILNALLMLINERRYHDGARTAPARLITLLGSSNDVPDDPLLEAFSDRFLLRCRLDYVEDEAIEDVLRLGWDTESGVMRTSPDAEVGAEANPDPAAVSAAGFALADLIALQRTLADIDVSPIRPLFSRILRAFRAEGVVFSDRRAVKAQKVFAANALLAGRRNAEIADIAPLVYLWTRKDDEATVRRIVADHEVPVADRSHVMRDPTEITYDLGQLRRQQQSVDSREEFRESLRRLQRLLTEVRRDHPDNRQLLAGVEQQRDEVLRTYRERFAQEGFLD